jgi:hypothetical protein
VNIQSPSTAPMPHKRPMPATQAGSSYASRPLLEGLLPALPLSPLRGTGRQDLGQGGERFHVNIQFPSTAPMPNKRPIPATQAGSMHASRACCLPCLRRTIQGHREPISGPGWRKVPSEHPIFINGAYAQQKTGTCKSGRLHARLQTCPSIPAACPAAAEERTRRLLSFSESCFGGSLFLMPPVDACRPGERFHVNIKSPSTAPRPHKRPIPASPPPRPGAQGAKIWARVEKGSM